MLKRDRLFLLVVSLILLAASGCSTFTPAPTPLPTAAPNIESPQATLSPSPSAVPLSSATLAPQGTATPAPSPSLSPSRAGPVTPRLVVIAVGLSSPDDMVLAPDSSLYFTDVGDGTVRRLSPDGQVTLVLARLSEPEGLVFLPDGSLIIVEQGRNRLLRYDFASKQLTPYLQLENRTNQAGVDSITLDPHDQSLLVPDSPNGAILRVSSAKTVTRLAGGLVRPTGLALASDGSLVVADEFGNAVVRVRLDARPTTEVIARLSEPDDVVIGADGAIYVNSLTESTIHRIDPATGRDEVLYRGLKTPQGIVFDQDGNLVIAEAGSHRLVKLLLR
ncbi:MAG: NHL repeat-containing protein [Anaerolineae bacterium]